MRRLAKLGFTQSYTYFAWRNTHDEIVGYLTELTRSGMREYLPAELLAQHPGHPDRLPADRRAPRVHRAPGARGDPLAPTTASTDRRSSWASTRRSPQAARSTSTRKSTRSAHGTTTTPGACADLIGRVNAIRRAQPRAAIQRGAGVSPDRQPAAGLLLEDRSGPHGPRPVRRQPGRALSRSPGGPICACMTWASATSRSRSTTCSVPRRWHGTGRGTSSSWTRRCSRPTSSSSAGTSRTEHDFHYFT